MDFQLDRRTLLKGAGAALMPWAARAQSIPASFLKLPERYKTERAMSSGSFPRGKSALFTLEGPGCIRHMWTALRPVPMANRNMILRIWFDGEKDPSLEAPVGDLYGLCHGIPFYPLQSLYLTTQDQAGYNCYF